MQRFSRPGPTGTTALVSILLCSGIPAQNGSSSLESRVAALESEMERLRFEHYEAQAHAQRSAAEMEVVLEELEDLRAATSSSGGTSSQAAAASSGAGGWTRSITLGGYGETHLNVVEGPGSDMIDNHRVVAYLGVAFNDWITLNTEVELEHSFVEEGQGEISLEQLYTDFEIVDEFNVRAGRFLTPLGIINQRHEPDTYNGVERPLIDTVLIPTTWSSDGAGFFGRIGDAFSYEVYVGSGLDGSGLDAVSGIRGGRQKERPGISRPAVSGRVDARPFQLFDDDSQNAGLGDLRLGGSFFAGGLDNGNRGRNPDVDGTLSIWSGDFEWTAGDFDLRGVLVFEHIDDAADLNRDIGGNVAEWLAGYSIEAAWHFWPEALQQGKLVDSDAIVFARFEDLNTQWQMPSGFEADGRGDRELLTAGLSFFPTSRYVIKGDVQFMDDDTSKDLPVRFNLGLGWSF